jgi:hypothetical protein
MAKVYTETVEINIQRLVKAGQNIEPLVNEEIMNTLEQVAEQLFENQAVVELSYNPESTED